MSRMTAETEAALDSLLSHLNPEQRAAANHGYEPLLIVAGAGTGKTTTLAHRVASLIARGVDPGRILLLTFTRRSAAEMLRRVDSLLVQMGMKKLFLERMLYITRPGVRRFRIAESLVS